MKIVIGADHAGFELKETVKKKLTAMGHEVRDVGTISSDSVDYPDYAQKVAEKISSGEIKQGVLICGSGIGMAIAANKFANVRAVVGNDLDTARLSRRHNDANILTMGSRLIDAVLAERIVEVWLNTEFEGGRHQRRIDKIEKLNNDKKDS